MPVLFYVAAILIFSIAVTDSVYVTLAWIFVALRIAHAVIHCTNNRIRHRFYSYALSSLALWILWLRLAYQLFHRVWVQAAVSCSFCPGSSQS